ncbi:alpha/beta hydrolase [Franzmannia pantelleriensis]|uniref:alpha/beta hydrolase n=1 Tax=Franzmannia pantelleriensis TaxID=48727 RepID=UPI001C40B4E3|nr:alpha/beta hydrolase [Halomonas pantelleriensis]
MSASKTTAQTLPAVSIQYPCLHSEDRCNDLLNHPAFRDFSHRMLPWDGQNYDLALPLKEIGQLLPYHSQVAPAVVIAALNRMVHDVSADRTVFYEFYTDAQLQAQPALKNTGLFFFRGKPGAPFAVIAPGGGFTYVASVHEGFPYAEEISKQGLNAFVLTYRTGQGGRMATEDLAAAIAYIVENADVLQVDMAGYSLWGSSAGARMAAAIGSHGTAWFGAPSHPKPSVVIMAYTGHSEVATSEPPTFVVVGDGDGISPPTAMETRIAALRRIGTRVEYHKYSGVGHGFGTGQGTSAQGWIGQAIRFWKKEIEIAS